MTDGSDLEWLGLERVGPGHWSFDLTPGLSRLDGKFYGGTGIAVATAVMEAETGRRSLWASVQYVASGATGDRFDCWVEISASGRRTSQVHISGREGDRLVFSALGATGEPRTGPLEAQFLAIPEVPPPGSCEPWTIPAAFLADTGGSPGWLSITDARTAPNGAMWMRLRDRPLSRPAMAFLADVIPSAVVRAARRSGAGTSLDNTIRFGPEPEGDWMLVGVEPHLISSGYVHGSAGLWSSEGTLLGMASQTASLILMD